MAGSITGTLEVDLKHAVNLKEVEWFGTQDPFVLLKCGRTRHKSKVHRDGGKNPIWNEHFSFPDVHAECILEVQIFDKNVRMRDELIGYGSVLLNQMTSKLDELQELQLPVRRLKGKSQGNIILNAQFTQPSSEQNKSQSLAQPTAAAPPPAPHLPEWITQETVDLLAHYTLDTAVLGKGTFGTTRLATSKCSGENYACKTVSKAKLRSIQEVEDLRREIKIMHHLAGHPSVVKIKGVYESRSDVHIVMELCTGGELFERISNHKRYTESEAANAMRSIIAVVKHCHEMGVMHRDLKPENFLLQDSSHRAAIKATDFGLGVFFQEGQVFTDVVGSPYFVAPEVLRRRYSKEADIWSCGVILYMLLSGSPPFFGCTDHEVFDAILQGNVNLTSHPWSKISDAAKDCVRCMLVTDPQKRATAADVLQHPWMRENGAAGDTELEVEVLKRMRSFAAANKMKKEAMKVIARSLPEEEMAGLETLFREFDSDGNGTITVDELREGLRKKGMLLREWDLQCLMEDADVNGDGNLDYEEFTAAAMNMTKLDREEHLMRAFQHFDRDNNGFISKEELAEVLIELSQGITNIEEILEEADADGNGQIDYHEFTAMMRCQQPCMV